MGTTDSDRDRGRDSEVQYVRFQSPHRNSRGHFTGVFGLVNNLAREGRLSDEQETFRRGGNRWYDAAYTDPSTVDPHVYDDEINPGAAAWFKPSATHLLARVSGYLEILSSHGVACRALRRRRLPPTRTPTAGSETGAAGSWVDVDTDTGAVVDGFGAGGVRRHRPRPQARRRSGARTAAPEHAQSMQNSLPSMSCIGMHASLPSYSVRTCTAPSGTSRARSASSAARRSSPTSPVPTRTSRCTRFLAAFPSGTRWKYSRGPTPDGSTQANQASRSSGGRERWYWSHVANPPVAAERRTPTPRTRSEPGAQVPRSRR